MPETLYWHDYETFGADPARDRPVQFAGMRTDLDLNPLGEPLVRFAKPANDCLPHPQAALVTGISPQMALEQGVTEREFIAEIHAELARPGTCGVGYNSIRFDDEVTRYTLYRNFWDPYAREWQNGNSRWDIIDLLRTAFALRPQGIEWPLREDGLPSFRLEELTAANGISHANAHDALADVHATIAMARLVRDRQPRLYQYLFEHRDKRSVLSMLDLDGMRPLLHVSGMFGAKRHNIALIVPLAVHPENRNEIVCYDLSVDPAPLIELSVDAISERLFKHAAELPAGSERLGLKSVHANRCPVLVTAKMADSKTAERLGINGATCREHLAALRAFRERNPREFVQKIQAIFAARRFAELTDPERMLYSGGFFSDSDKNAMESVRNSDAAELASSTFTFEDARLSEMLFRYRARNYPESLGAEEVARWEEYRFERLTNPAAGASICLEEYQEVIDSLLTSGELDAEQEVLMLALQDYGDALLA
ncbi:MAG: exodeoxyribonuclease I [Pseudomonadota bacterium]